MIIHRVIEYRVTKFRLMEKGARFDTQLAEGSLDQVIAARDKYARDNGRSEHDTCADVLYFQAHCPDGHPDFPGSSGCWVWYSVF